MRYQSWKLALWSALDKIITYCSQVISSDLISNFVPRILFQDCFVSFQLHVTLYLPNIPDFEFLWMGQGCKLFCLHVYSTERKRNKLEITDWCKNLGVKHRGFQCYWIKKQKVHSPNQPVELRLFWCWTLDLILTYILLNSQSLNNISI